MKKLIAILALLSLTGNIASAELLKNFKYDGKIEVHAFQQSNGDWNADVKDAKDNDTDTRVQINMGFELNDDADAVVSIIKNDREYGDGSQVVNDATGGGNGIMEQLYVEQAYMNLKGVFNMDHKLGRQYYGEEGSLIAYYGPEHWAYQPTLPVTGIDGWTGWYTNDKWNLHALLGNLVNDTLGPDRALAGVVANYDLSDELKLNGYVYQQNTQHGAGQVNDRLEIVGAKAHGMFAGFNYKAEIAKNFGRNNEVGGTVTPYAGVNNDNSYEGMAIKLNADYEMDIAGKLAFMGEYAMGSGDDNNADKKVEAFYAIASDYRPGIIWGGYNGTTGLTNLTTWNVGAKWMPESIEKLTLKAKLFGFAPTEDKGLTYDSYGTELDFVANWQHSENVGIKAYYAWLMPDSKYAVALNGAGAKDDAEKMLGAAFTVKF